MDLLRASMISHTPLSDLLLDKTKQTNSGTLESESRTSIPQVKKEDLPNNEKMILNATLLKSTNKLLFVQAKKDFIEFLFSLLSIPLGGVESLLASKSLIMSIDNLYKSVSDHIDDEYFKTCLVKDKLLKPQLPHGYVSTNQILPLAEESLSDSYDNIALFSFDNFPQGKGNYIKGGRTYQVMDDLTVIPFYISSILCSLNEQMIPVCDVKEVDIEIGLEEVNLLVLLFHSSTNISYS